MKRLHPLSRNAAGAHGSQKHDGDVRPWPRARPEFLPALRLQPYREGRAPGLSSGAARQLFRCNDCQRRFSRSMRHGKRTPGNAILRAVVLVCRGCSYEEAWQAVRRELGVQRSKAAISRWVAERTLPYLAIRDKNAVHGRPLVRSYLFTHNALNYRYQVHCGKLVFARALPDLVRYLQTLPDWLDHSLFCRAETLLPACPRAEPRPLAPDRHPAQPDGGGGISAGGHQSAAPRRRRGLPFEWRSRHDRRRGPRLLPAPRIRTYRRPHRSAPALRPDGPDPRLQAQRGARTPSRSSASYPFTQRRCHAAPRCRSRPFVAATSTRSTRISSARYP